MESLKRAEGARGVEGRSELATFGAVEGSERSSKRTERDSKSRFERPIAPPQTERSYLRKKLAVVSRRFKSATVKGAVAALILGASGQQFVKSHAFEYVAPPRIEIATRSLAVEHQTQALSAAQQNVDRAIQARGRAPNQLTTQVDTAQRRLNQAQDEFQRWDEIFLSRAVQETLEQIGVTVSEYKALIAQESGDMLIDDRRGNIRGLAQAGAAEAREVGKTLDRSKPEDAILLGARILVQKAEQLEVEARQLGLDAAPFKGTREYKKLIFASYNAGARPVARAMKIAHDRGLAWYEFSTLTAPNQKGARSALQIAIAQTPIYKHRARGKYGEVTTYVARIEQRLPSRDVNA